MLCCIVPEVSLCIGLIMIILYGLFSLSMSSTSLTNKLTLNHDSYKFYGDYATMVNLYLSDVYFFSRAWPIMLLLGYAVDFPFILTGLSTSTGSIGEDTAVFAAEPVADIYQISAAIFAYPYNNGIDVLLILLTVVIMQSFKSFESVLLLLLAFVGQLFMLHSCDLVSFYICLEAQNFCFLVLCGLQPRVLKYASSASIINDPSAAKAGGSRPLAGVEASIKYLLLSAFSSGVLLFWFSALYLQTGITTLSWGPLTSNFFNQDWTGTAQSDPSKKLMLFTRSEPREAETSLGLSEVDPKGSTSWIRTGQDECLGQFLDQSGYDQLLDTTSSSFMDVMPQMVILLALMFKLGGAPLHLWMVDIYSGVKRQLLMYLSTAPKLSLFGFWVSTWHSVWTDFTVLLFVALSMIIGCFGAYSQPSLRSLFAYSTINEIGLMLMAIETAGFHSLFQHLTIYIITMLLLWNNSDKRLFAILAVSLAGLPPLAGFFGKAWIFNSVATGALAGPYLGILAISLFCTGLSLVYYLRVFRLFNMGSYNYLNRVTNLDLNSGSTHVMNVETRTYCSTVLDVNIKLTSFCASFLIYCPLFYIKPFVF